MLYVNGDSHSAGCGLSCDATYAQLLADHYGYELVNQAVIGSSNARILRTTEEFLTNHTPKLIVIGWSTWEREEWLHDGQYYNVNSSGHTGLPEDLAARYKQWVVDQTSDAVDVKSRQTHDQIYELHCVLQDNNIPHVFFNCMYNFFSIKEPKNWNDSYIGPYNNDASYYWYLKNRGFETDEWYHYGANGHRVWADFLINYIDQHDIIR